MALRDILFSAISGASDFNLQMITTLAPATHRATFAIGDEQTAKRVADLLTENFFDGEAAIAAFEGPTGRWDITVHFAQAPDEKAVFEAAVKEFKIAQALRDRIVAQRDEL